MMDKNYMSMDSLYTVSCKGTYIHGKYDRENGKSIFTCPLFPHKEYSNEQYLKSLIRGK